MSFWENQKGVNRGQKIMKILQEVDKEEKEVTEKFWVLK